MLLVYTFQCEKSIATCNSQSKRRILGPCEYNQSKSAKKHHTNHVSMIWAPSSMSDSILHPEATSSGGSRRPWRAREASNNVTSWRMRTSQGSRKDWASQGASSSPHILERPPSWTRCWHRHTKTLLLEEPTPRDLASSRSSSPPPTHKITAFG